MLSLVTSKSRYASGIMRRHDAIVINFEQPHSEHSPRDMGKVCRLSGSPLKLCSSYTFLRINEIRLYSYCKLAKVLNLVGGTNANTERCYSLQLIEKIKESYNWVVDLNQNIVFFIYS